MTINILKKQSLLRVTHENKLQIYHQSNVVPIHHKSEEFAVRWGKWFKSSWEASEQLIRLKDVILLKSVNVKFNLVFFFKFTFFLPFKWSNFMRHCNSTKNGPDPVVPGDVDGLVLCSCASCVVTLRPPWADAPADFTPPASLLLIHPETWGSDSTEGQWPFWGVWKKRLNNKLKTQFC